MTEARQSLQRAIAKHGVSEVLASLGAVLQEGEAKIKETHDAALGDAYDHLLTTLVELFPLTNKRGQALAKMTLRSQSVMAGLVTRKANSEGQSPAMREAYKFIQDLE